jgi:hypothetical protein
MCLGHQRLDLDHLADREHFAPDLLHNSRPSFVKYCADKQFGFNRHNNCPCSTKQYRLCVSFIGHGESQENPRAGHFTVSNEARKSEGR